VVGFRRGVPSPPRLSLRRSFSVRLGPRIWHGKWVCCPEVSCHFTTLPAFPPQTAAGGTEQDGGPPFSSGGAKAPKGGTPPLSRSGDAGGRRISWENPLAAGLSSPLGSPRTTGRRRSNGGGGGGGGGAEETGGPDAGPGRGREARARGRQEGGRRNPM